MKHGRIAALAAVGALLAGCAGAKGPGADDAVDALRQARQKVAAAGSAHIEATMHNGSRLSSRSSGALGWSDGIRGTLTTRITGGRLAADTRELGGDPSQTRYLPDAYYTRMTDEFAGLQDGKHWIRYPYDSSSDLTPADALKALGAMRDVHEAGRATVGGIETTRYQGTSGRQHVEVWIDARHLMVQRVYREGEFTTTARYSDYGAPARAERPPAHDTVNFDTVTEAAAGSG
ncbi:hypothetical protein [Streptomyces sp. VRA16 Mangrove soil]|uniref:hypothetical protein n=1 Tax=Streptomyces sp. VRA16 Mangrove soil TaxID=2817434 RepID=UPI001A9F9CCE|nr:hypothetical protein [Streptomyces sp. VRA16 Mangrove soil]MBO1334991.1 hypothetical protein [Streptomyces sp. VRA16 Mangrove soil]